jgi:hypothetical protein
MKLTNSEVLIRQPGHGMDQLTTGTLHADGLDYEDPEGWIGQTVTVSTFDQNGSPVEFDGELIEVL